MYKTKTKTPDAELQRWPRVRALVALVEDLDAIPVLIWWLRIIYNADACMWGAYLHVGKMFTCKIKRIMLEERGGGERGEEKEEEKREKKKGKEERRRRKRPSQ